MPEGPSPTPSRRAPIPTRVIAPPKPAPAPEPPAPAFAPEPLPPAAPAPPGSGPAIRVQGLRRVFGKKVALEGATFEVMRGEVFGFLGPNGAGKTTTIRILTGLLRATGGEAWIHGERAGPDGAAAKALLGFVPDEPAFPARLKALPLLKMYGAFHGLDGPGAERRARELLARVGLEKEEQATLRSFSHGMRKRYALAQALLHDPPLLVMDEPSSGLDPAGTAWFRQAVRSLRDQGKTVFYSSHILPEVQQVADRVGIINQGRVVAVDSIGNLGRRVRARAEIVVTAEGMSEAVVQAVREVRGVLAVRADGPRLVVEAEDGEVASEVNAAMLRAGAKVRSLESTEPSLEDIYLSMTREARP